MDNEKIANILMKVQADDLKDAEMLADYAEEMKNAGDMALASALAARSKARLSQMYETDRSIKNVLARVTEMGEVIDFQSLYEKRLAHSAEKLTEKLNRM